MRTLQGIHFIFIFLRKLEYFGVCLLLRSITHSSSHQPQTFITQRQLSTLLTSRAIGPAMAAFVMCECWGFGCFGIRLDRKGERERVRELTGIRWTHLYKLAFLDANLNDTSSSMPIDPMSCAVQARLCRDNHVLQNEPFDELWLFEKLDQDSVWIIGDYRSYFELEIASEEHDWDGVSFSVIGRTVLDET